jgi:cytoskeletal protein CcmA (bactofilin family)
MGMIGASVTVRGEVRSAQDVTIAGRIEGPIMCEGAAVTIAATAEVSGDIIARDITIFGRCTGRMIATEIVDVRPASIVSGQVIAARFVLHDGATFHGRVEPQHLATAVRVAKYQQRREAAGSADTIAGVGA